MIVLLWDLPKRVCSHGYDSNFSMIAPPWALTLPLMHRDFGAFLGNFRPPDIV
jgi:hypothetical protein